ncbi:recombinase family protein [Streptomyces shenzhenensis]|uniref:recombinase family protein n=1 Tax=Streptomyces shenzhenensis TaxID=943815 RepID=UPI0036AE7299
MGTEPLTRTNAGMNQLRALSALRLSVLTDETTSPERQRAANKGAASAVGAAIIGEAVDIGVSASKTTPFERPELGAWLARPDDFDVIVWWRFDRAVRSMADLNELALWAREHRKILVFAEGPGGRLTLDFRNGVDLITQLIIQVFAFAAEFEAASIRERVTGAQAAMRTMPLRWRGSRPPYGYEPAPLESGGFTLVPDADAVAVIERMTAALMDGKTASTVAAELNVDGIPSPRDHWSLRQGRSTGGRTGGAKGEHETRERFSWGPSIVKKVLTSVSLLGWKTHNGNPVRDSEGAPVMSTTTPVLTREEFDVIGALFAERSIDNRQRKDTSALLLRVIHCVSCGGRMYLNAQGGKTPAYKCNAHARGDSCEAPASIRAEWAEGYAEREFLRTLGALNVTRTREIPGYDPAPEIAATLAEFEEHQAQEGRQRSKAAREAWQRRADALDARLAELESRGATPARTEVISSGRTYADLWESADMAGRRRLMVEAGACLGVRRGKRGGWRSLDESRVSFDIRAPFFADAAADLVAMAEELAHAS